jgi:hypothetical protein
MRLTPALFSFGVFMFAFPANAQVPSPAPTDQRLVIKPADMTFQDAYLHTSGRTYVTTYEPSHGLPSFGPFTPQIYTYKSIRGRGSGDDVKIHHDFRLLYELGDGKAVGIVGNGIGGVVHF